MKIVQALRRFSSIRPVFAAVAALSALLAAPAAFAGTSGGAGAVTYNIPEQIEQGNMPYTASYTLIITSPEYLPAGNYSVTLNLTLLSAPTGVTTSQALSFVTISSNTSLLGGLLGNITNLLGPIVGATQTGAATIGFTGPSQQVAVTVTTTIPAGNWAGSFGYGIQTSGWASSLGVTDQGCTINDTVALPPGLLGLPSVTILAPINNTQYALQAGSYEYVAGNSTEVDTVENVEYSTENGFFEYVPSAGSNISIAYNFTGNTSDGSPLIAMNGTVNGISLGVVPTGLNEANTTATAKGTFSVSEPGIYTVTATDANANGVDSQSVELGVNIKAGPPSVVIDTPAANSTYTLTGNSISVPLTFTGFSEYGGVTELSATLDGTPISVSTGDLGNNTGPGGSGTSLGTGTLPLTSVGLHTLAVTATDDFGSTTASEPINVIPGSVINLGDAAGFSVLVYNASNNSDSAYQCGSIGVVKGNWAQSGGQQTNAQDETTVYLSPGYTSSGPAVETTVIDGTLLNSAWTAAVNESATLAAMTPTQTFGSINLNNSNLTITETVVGTYVFDFTNISLNHPASLVLNAPAGSTVIVNISGSVQLNGSSNGGWMVIGGGLTSTNVIYNFTGTGSVLHTAGGGNGSVIQGIVLAPNGQVQLDPGEVEGEVIANTFSTSSGTLVQAPCQ